MNLTDILLDLGQDTMEYENEFMKVLKVIKEIPNSGKNRVKRLQLVVWKSKDTDIPDIDIRIYNKNEDSYSKGITFSLTEAKELNEALKEFLDEYK